MKKVSLLLSLLACPLSAFAGTALESAQNIFSRGADRVYDGKIDHAASSIDAGLATAGLYSGFAATLKKPGELDAESGSKKSSERLSQYAAGRAGRKPGNRVLGGIARVGAFVLGGSAAAGALIWGIPKIVSALGTLGFAGSAGLLILAIFLVGSLIVSIGDN